jgi:hypothetical protein
VTPSPQALPPTGVSPIDWGAAAVFLIGFGVVLAAIRQGFTAPASVYRHYKDDRLATKNAIDADHVIPALTELVVQVVEQAATLAGLDIVPISRNDIEQSLQWAGHLQQLESLSTLYMDYARIDLLVGSAIRWARARSIMAGIALTGLLPVGSHFVLVEMSTAQWLWVAGIFTAVFAGIGALGAWFVEMNRRNELAELFVKYE